MQTWQSKSLMALAGKAVNFELSLQTLEKNQEIKAIVLLVENLATGQGNAQIPILAIRTLASTVAKSDIWRKIVEVQRLSEVGTKGAIVTMMIVPDVIPDEMIDLTTMILEVLRVIETSMRTDTNTMVMDVLVPGLPLPDTVVLDLFLLLGLHHDLNTVHTVVLDLFLLLGPLALSIRTQLVEEVRFERVLLELMEGLLVPLGHVVLLLAVILNLVDTVRLEHMLWNQLEIVRMDDFNTEIFSTLEGTLDAV